MVGLIQKERKKTLVGTIDLSLRPSQEICTKARKIFSPTENMQSEGLFNIYSGGGGGDSKMSKVGLKIKLIPHVLNVK